MEIPTSPNWKALKESHDERLVEALRGHFERGPFEIRAMQLANEAQMDVAGAKALLDDVAAQGAIGTDPRIYCPAPTHHLLSPTEADSGVCPQCNQGFGDLGGEPEQETWYIRNASPTRDVRWMLALHGMNTLGPWQEEFNWLVARTHGRSIPLAIYKYGVIRPGAVLRWRLKGLEAELRRKIRQLSSDTEQAGFGGVPDVIAHSLGTRLLGLALLNDSQLRVGRVVLTGCILRPDFNWSPLLARGQVEAVLCHSGTKDFWARIAHYIIPDAGPAGRRGFNDRKNVAHAVLAGGAHSDFFLQGQMSSLFLEVWQPFLTKPIGEFVGTDVGLKAPPWRPARWLFEARLWRVAVITFASTLAGFFVAALTLGMRDVWILIARLLR
jgi:hypothetical protein